MAGLFASLAVEQLPKDVEVAKVTGGFFDHVNEHPAQGDIATGIPRSIIELEENSTRTRFVESRRVLRKLTVERFDSGDPKVAVRILVGVAKGHIHFAEEYCPEPGSVVWRIRSA